MTHFEAKKKYEKLFGFSHLSVKYAAKMTALFFRGWKKIPTFLFNPFLFLMADENIMSPQGQVRYVNLLSEM